MAHLMLVPEWFRGYDILLEFSFALISLLVGIYALRIFKLTSQRRPKLFGIAFLFISASYFVQSAANFALIENVDGCICSILSLAEGLPSLVGLYLFMLLFGTGLVLLSYMSLKIESRKTLALIWIICALSVALSANMLYIFYLVCSILLIFVISYYIQNFLAKRKARNILVVIAFSFLLFSTIHFIFSVNHSLFYMIGHILEFVAYILILINFLLALK